MKRLLVLASVLFLVAGCSKVESAAQAAKQAAKMAQKAAAEAEKAADRAVDEDDGAMEKAAADEATDEATEEAPYELTEADLKKFEAYQQRAVVLLAAYVENLKATGKRVDEKEGTAAAFAALSAMKVQGDAFEKAQNKAREEVGLDEGTLDHVEDIVGDVLTERMLYEKSGGDAQAAQLKANMEKQLAGLPKEAQATARKDLEEMTNAFSDRKRAADAREKYGDAAVDLVLAHEATLMPLHEKMFKAGVGLMQ